VYPKVSGLSHNEIYAYNNKHPLRSNTKGYGGKTHYNYSQNSDTTAPSGRELYHLQFSLQVASPETFGYTILCNKFKLLLGSKKVGGGGEFVRQNLFLVNFQYISTSQTVNKKSMPSAQKGVLLDTQKLSR
jgi:hypothetical protein